MKRVLRIGLWGFLYWFAGCWWLARYFDVEDLAGIRTDAILWAIICIGIEATRTEVIE